MVFKLFCFKIKNIVILINLSVSFDFLKIGVFVFCFFVKKWVNIIIIDSLINLVGCIFNI